MWAFFILFFGFQPLAHADGYSLTNAPWSGETFEICETPLLNGLRPVIFNPVYEQGESQVSGQSTRLEIEFDPDSGEPRIVEKVINAPARYLFLKEQYIGFVDSNDDWVNENGLPVSDKSEFVKHIGDRGQGTKQIWPILEALKGETAYERFDYAIDMAKNELVTAPDCTIHYTFAYDVVPETVQLEYGPNNPMICDADKGYRVSSILDKTITVQRHVVSMPDGGAHLIRLPGGEIKVFGDLQFDQVCLLYTSPSPRDA